MNYEFCDGVTHTIKKGDTLYEISRKYRVPLALLLRANPYVDVFNLQVGDTICVPESPRQMPQCPKEMAMPSDEMESQQETVVQPISDFQRKEKDDDDDDDKDDDKDECKNSWEKYVVQPGDTLADVMADMKGDVEDFVDKNGLDSIYMLPGVAYYICR